MSEQATHEQDTAAQERKKRYKKSLNLPRTDFAMRANLVQNEPQSQRRWQEMGLYERVLEARADCPPYVFHDGPPYANGSIHVGHLLNKTLKDIVTRSRNLMGWCCPYIPGWDCHGLPIEHKVLTELADSGKAAKLEELEPATRRVAIRRECARYAKKYKELQATQMARLHTLADYDNPYLTMAPEYEAAVLEVFADLVDQGIVYRDLKPVHWSISNETALAEAELEYYDRTDPSIYVWFDAADPAAVLRAFDLETPLDAVSFLIWTTTPWTLPANLLIAVHEPSRYALVRLGGRCSVVAKQLVEKVAALHVNETEILAETDGASLLGLEYRHPFVDKRAGFDSCFRLVGADYVTLEDGTGLVHTAPGHGADDYYTGIRESAPVYCPVRADGTYDETVPESLRGLSIWDANPQIVEALRDSGHLYYTHDYSHSYPHDWRSKTPVIFRATEQWFAAVDRPLRHDDEEHSLRDLALAAVEKQIRFFPGWGRNRMRGMIESRPDWCLSRQRSWGLPIPAFRLPDGTIFLTAASVRAVAAAVAKSGSDVWFTEKPETLLDAYDAAADSEAPPPLAEGVVDKGDLEKLYDIFDVWFESGSSWHAVMRRRDQGFPTDLYLEGSDQHRGWFQASLLPSLGTTGMPPFKNVLTHGFIVDKEGKKQSKSSGNALEVDDLLRDYGADVCRWWVSSLAFENDIKVDREFFDLAGESYRKVRNTLRFLLSNLADFERSAAVAIGSLPATSLDRFALAEASRLRQSVIDAYTEFDFRQAHLLLFDFCNDTLSSFYLDAVKDRLYCDRPDSPRRRATQSALYSIAGLLCSLLAPILPHTADEAYRSLHHDEGDEQRTVHTQTIPALEVIADADWAFVVATREAVRKKIELAKERGIENPLDAGVTVADPQGKLAAFRTDLADVFGVSRVTLTGDEAEVAVIDLRQEPRCERSWRRDDTVRQRSDGGWLSDRDAEAVGLA